MRWAMAAFYCVAGLIHLRAPDAFLPIVHDWAPMPRDLVLFTGDLADDVPRRDQLLAADIEEKRRHARLSARARRAFVLGFVRRGIVAGVVIRRPRGDIIIRTFFHRGGRGFRRGYNWLRPRGRGLGRFDGRGADRAAECGFHWRARRFRWWASMMLAIYAVCVFPANIKHAIEGIQLPGLTTSWLYHAPRLALQPVIVWWALYCGHVVDWPFRRNINP